MGSYIIFYRPHLHYVEVVRVLHQRQNAQRAFSTKRRRITLTPEFEDAVWDRVDSGEYTTTGEVLTACIEALEYVEGELDEDHKWLKREIQLGLEEGDPGEVIPGEQAIEQIRAKVRRRFAEDQ